MLGKAGCNELVIQLVYEFFLLTMCPDNVLESWLHSFVFTSLGTLFFQTRLVLYLHQLEYGTGLQEPWSGLPHSLASVRGDKAKTGFQFMLKGCLCHILVVHLQHRSLYLILELMVVRKAENIWSLICEFSGLLWWKEPVRVVFLMYCSVPLLWQLHQLFTLILFSAVGLMKWIMSNRFVVNMVKGHHLWLRCHSMLFCNFKQFHIKLL